MPITSIWPIKGSYVQALTYIANPIKTAADGSVITELENVLDYVSNGEKTNQKYYVTGINCDPDEAALSFQKTKTAFGKPGGVLAFNAIQSFKPGEVDPDTCHKIGVKLAAKMWGDKFEVVVCTHLDKDHPHNHFVLNSVSWVDGRKFDNSRKDYQRFSSLSDDLARQYDLSVIDKPQGKSRHYAEWKSDQEYKPTIRSMIKEDIDYVISTSESFREFEINLRKLGYEIKRGKHLAVKAPGGKRFIRLYKLSDTEDYSIDAIKEKILNNSVVHFKAFYSPAIPETITIAGKTKETKKLKGFQAMYVKYMFQMGILPEHQTRNQRVPFSMKQDLQHLDDITEQVTYLFRHEIVDNESLSVRLAKLADEKAHLTSKSKSLYSLIRRSDDSVLIEKLKSERETIQESLKEIRKEIRLCENIQKRSEALETRRDQQNYAIEKKKALYR